MSPVSRASGAAVASAVAYLTSSLTLIWFFWTSERSNARAQANLLSHARQLFVLRLQLRKRLGQLGNILFDSYEV